MLQKDSVAEGMRIAATYKRRGYVAEVVEVTNGEPSKVRITESGKRTLIGKEYGSLSAAGRAITNGTRVNGWRFFTAIETPKVVAIAETTQPEVVETDSEFLARMSAMLDEVEKAETERHETAKREIKDLRQRLGFAIKARNDLVIAADTMAEATEKPKRRTRRNGESRSKVGAAM